jgi:hypothetical protein
MMASEVADGRITRARFLEWDVDPFAFPEPWFMRGQPVARILRDRWEALCQETMRTGWIEELHAARGDIQAVFDRYLALFKDYGALFDLSGRLGDRNGRFHQAREAVARATDELARLYGEIFPGWQTLHDLAEMLIETFPLSQEQLKALAAAHPPPQSWYDEDFDPFTPDPEPKG